MCKLKISHVRYINHMYPIGLSKPMLPCVMGRRGFAAPPHRVDFYGDGQIRGSHRPSLARSTRPEPCVGDGQSIGLRLATIAARCGSRKGANTIFSPSVAGSSSTAKPGPSEAISNRMPFGSWKYTLRNQ